MNRVYGLDILRAIAILLVIYAHSYKFFNAEYIYIFDGVLLFFVLSGFLIGSILLKIINKHEFSFKDLTKFWYRRWMRTLPAYFFVLTALVIFQAYNHNWQLSYLKNYFFIQTLKPWWTSLYPESWSLSIEEWFYLSFPLLIFLSLRFSKDRKKVMLLLVGLIITSATLTRIYLLNRYSYNTVNDFQQYVREPLVMRMDSIIYGILGAVLNYYKFPIWRKKNLFFVIGIILCVFCSVNYNIYSVNWFTKYAYLSVGSIAVLMLLPKLNGIKTGKGITFKTLTFISVISYSIYLLNMTPFNLLTEKLNLHGLTGWILFMLWSLGASYLLNRLIEKPFMNLRDRKSIHGLNKINQEKKISTRFII